MGLYAKLYPSLCLLNGQMKGEWGNENTLGQRIMKQSPLNIDLVNKCKEELTKALIAHYPAERPFEWQVPPSCHPESLMMLGEWLLSQDMQLTLVYIREQKTIRGPDTSRLDPYLHIPYRKRYSKATPVPVPGTTLYQRPKKEFAIQESLARATVPKSAWSHVGSMLIYPTNSPCNPLPSESQPPTRKQLPVPLEVCICCKKEVANVWSVRCGHYCACYTCCQPFIDGTAPRFDCPVCYKQVDNIRFP